MPNVDASNTERWLIYGHDLTREFSPIVLWLFIITAMVAVLLIIYAVKFVIWIRRKPSNILKELREVNAQLESLQIIKEDIVLIRVDISSIDGRLGGTVDAVKDIMRNAALRERESLNDIKLEVKKMEHVHASIAELIDHLPTSGSA